MLDMFSLRHVFIVFIENVFKVFKNIYLQKHAKLDMFLVFTLDMFLKTCLVSSMFLKTC